jgi:hypothetical protein
VGAGARAEIHDNSLGQNLDREEAVMRNFLVALAATVMIACSDSNPRNGSSSAIPNAGAGEKINMFQLDTSSRTAPAAAPVLRDSASGPRMQIDSAGKVTPIKK